MAQAIHQPDRIDQEAADDRRVEALVVQHQHRFVESRTRVHDEAAGAGLRRTLAEVRCDEALAVHGRQVQVTERGHRAAAAVRRQASDAGAFEEEGEQFGPGEDPRDQFAILEVVVRQRRFVLGEHPVDLVHALVRRADRLTLAEQRLRDVLQAERGEAPGRRAQRLDAVDDQPACGGREEVLLAAVLAPLHRLAAAPQQQRHLEPLRVLVQHAQVELHQVPADDRVRVMQRHPAVEALQQLRAAVAILQREVQPGSIAVGRPEHVHLALAAAFQGDGIEFAALGGLDVQRYQAQLRAIVRRRFQHGVEEHPVGVGRAGELHGRGDEALHQVALRWPDVGFVDVQAGATQALLQLNQLAMLTAVQPEHRAMLEVTEFQRTQLDVALTLQQQFHPRALLGGHEGHRGLQRQTQAPRAVVGRQPELHLGARGRVLPVPGQNEALL